MTNQPGNRGVSLITSNSLIVMAALLGLCLRVWQLGGKNFWLDELGVAQAAFQPTLPLALKAAGEHIMAMPLDYVIAWIAARFSQAEGWLRLPEALWGFLVLPIGYKLSLRLSDSRRVAGFTLLLLALSPILIAYSQELRFYAPLIFFFTASAYLGLAAVQEPRVGNWVTFTLVTLLGIYFHLYTILAVGSVLLWLLPHLNKDGWTLRRNSFAVSALILAVAFLHGLFTFGGVYADRPLSLFEYESFSTFLFTGLGWFPAYPAAPIGWFFGILLIVLALIGIGVTIKNNTFSNAALLFYATVLQIIMIIAFDYLKNYPLFARQIVMLVPALLFFSALGVDGLIGRLATRFETVLSTQQLIAAWTIFLLLAAFPALQAYYRSQKGSTQEILALLSDEWQAGETVHVEAGVFDVFRFYWEQDPANRPIAQALIPMDYASTDGWGHPAPAWFVVNFPPQADLQTALQDAGFNSVYIPISHTLHPQMLWHRP